ncbi:MAG: hypothetical protein F2659_07130 [Actinobacteria bacterium]|uniref:Unannotated protein n=1 Tax=freshwater metagenome TaxID=449393 RepID=A0A6J6Q1E7_9ZZZZ|nr:hypothetical protein [Actinomycetota bacterium]
MTTGLITGIPFYSWSIFPAGTFPAGLYKIGYACTLSGVTMSYFQELINVTTDASTGGPAQMSYTIARVPAAPTLASPLTTGNGTLAGTFTAPACTPACTSSLATATSPGKPTVTAVGSAGTFTLTGLVNKSAYSVTVTQTNAVGTSPASNAVVGTPADPNERDIVGFGAAPITPGTPNITPARLDWNAPASPPPSGQYTVAITNAGAPITGSPFTVSATTLSFPCTLALVGVSLSAAVTPVYVAPAFAPAVTTVGVFCNSATLVTQDITVTRPVGGLVLTQTCAKYGALPAEPTSLGFDAVLPAELASGTGSAPTINDPRTIVDPAFSQYPYPVDAIEVPNPTYPTHCALNLGIAKLITSGTEAGKYFKVDGRISQVAIVDTRDTDAGWVVSGKVSDFASGANTFSGNYLGWTPVKTSDSGVTLEGYDQTVNAGATVAPAFASGLTAAQPLATAAANQGLGIAYLDARLKLLIPVTANNGVYTATLTISAL